MQIRTIKFPDHPIVETHDILHKVKIHLEKLKDVKKDVVIVTQDYTRDCNWITHLLVREIANVIPAERLSIVVASGLHRASSQTELGNMFGDDIVRSIKICAHNPFSSFSGATFGLFGGYTIGIHCSLPHLHVGMSEVGKLILPGLFSGEGVMEWHGWSTQKALQDMESCNSGFDMIFDYGINDNGDAIKFFGSSIDNSMGYKLHIIDLRNMYHVKIPKDIPDVAILKPVVKNLDFILSMNAMQVCKTWPVVKEDGTICIMNPLAREMGVHYGFMQPNGINPAYYDEIFKSQYENRTVVFAMYNLQEHWIQEYFHSKIFNFKNEPALFDFIRSRYGNDAVIHEYEGADMMIGVR